MAAALEFMGPLLVSLVGMAMLQESGLFALDLGPPGFRRGQSLADGHRLQ